MTTLGEIADERPHAFVDGPFGSNLPASCYSADGVPVVRGSNLSLGETRFRDDEFVYVPDEIADRLQRSTCKALDIIFTKKGTLGQTGIIPARTKHKRYLLSGNQLKLTVNRAKADPLFVYYSVSSPASRTKLIRDSTVTGVPKTNLAYLKTFPIWLPSLPEQKSIAAVLGALDDKIELNRRMNATLEAVAQALFRSWFVDFDPVHAKLDGRHATGLDPAPPAVFPAGFQDSRANPPGWEIGKIRDCCVQIQNGGTPRRDEPRFWADGNIPWLTSSEVRQSIITATENFITEDGLAESSAKWVPAFSTVVALYGATAGQVSLVSSRLTTNQAVCALIPKKNFAFFNYLAMRGATADLENKAVGSAQQNISKAIVEETQVVVPPTPLIERFAEVASPLFERWISNLHQSRTLATIRDTLLPKLLSGDVWTNNSHYEQ